MHTRQTTSGFTLVELMIVVAIIAIIASIAIPNLLSSRTIANESAAIATLRSIASSQAQCRSSAAIDTNGNGSGEYGFLAELSGATGVRSDESGGVSTQRITPAVLSGAFGGVQNSRITRSGYLFQMFLPSSAAAPLTEAAAGGGAGVSVAAAESEILWSCYAWPASRGNSGRRAFFVNQWGEVLSCSNDVARYNGLLGPGGTAAVLGTVGGANMASSIAANATGQDGEVWRVVN